MILIPLRERATLSHVPPPWLAVWRQGNIYATAVYEASPGCRSAPGWAAGIGLQGLWGVSVVDCPPPWVQQCRGGWPPLSEGEEGAGGQGSSAGGGNGRLGQAGCWRHHKWAWDRVRKDYGWREERCVSVFGEGLLNSPARSPILKQTSQIWKTWWKSEKCD